VEYDPSTWGNVPKPATLNFDPLGDFSLLVEEQHDWPD
jgi:hypothetical protein